MKTIFSKTQSILITAILFNIAIIASSFVRVSNEKFPADDLEGTINISGAFALYPITVKWAEEFKKVHSKVKFNISAGGAGKGIADALSGLVDIGLASRDIYPEEVKKGAYTIYVTKDAVIPTFNTANPNARQLLTRGVKKGEFNNIFVTGITKNWNQLSGVKTSVPIHVYTRSDAAGAAESWAKFFNKKQEDLNGVAVFGDPGLAQAVKKDVAGIGFNNIAYLYDLKTRKQIAGVNALPLDVNGNGRIDPNENFYNTVDELTDAIASGRYPSPPARDLGFLFKGKPKKKELIEFVKYVLNDGQKFIDENGYVTLAKNRVQTELKKVN
jgi:phosphate transport system substrate-binding protein